MRFFTLLISFTLLSVISVGQNVVLFHTNDLHSKLNGYSPELEYSPLITNNDSTFGGFSRIATLIKDTKTMYPEDIVLTVDAGDFLMGSLFHPLEKETGFQLKLMQEMGYDYITLGNHEFDYGPEILAQIINNARKDHEIPKLLLSNIEFDKNDSSDDNLEKLFTEGVIKKYRIHEEKGIKIAFIGILGIDARNVQPRLTPVKITDPIKTAKKLSKKLIKSKEADIVICLSHSGVTYKKEKWAGEDVKMAKATSPYITAIISGHTHTTLENAIIEKNTSITQTGSGGKHVGITTLSPNEKSYGFKSYSLITVNDNILGSKEIQDKIEIEKLRVQTKLLDPRNIKYDAPQFETSFRMDCEENGNLDESLLGPILAESLYAYINDSEIKTDVSIVAAGIIRDQLRPGIHGKQSIADIFRILSLGEGESEAPGFPLSQIYITSHELKSTIEVLLMAQKYSPATYCYYNGIKIHVDMKKGFLNKVQSIEMQNDDSVWAPIDLTKKNDRLYGVSANSYLLSFISIIKKKSYGLVKVSPKNIKGEIIKDFHSTIIDMDTTKTGIQEGKEWLAFQHLVKTFSDTNNNGIPDIPTKYKTNYNPIFYLNKK